MIEKIEFIPLIELPTIKDKESQKIPEGTGLTNSKEWDKYQLQQIKKNYNEVLEPITSGVYQYEILKLSKPVLGKVIELHIADMRIDESCSFFGGFGLKIGEEIKLHPQCCGLFEEIHDWMKILNPSFDPFYLRECHPSPKFSLADRQLIITCEEEESFIPATDTQICVPIKDIRNALSELLEQLRTLSKTIDEIGNHFNEHEASKYLIWGEPH